MSSDTTFVAIFAGRNWYRVRQLAPGATQAQIVKWCRSYDEAEQFVDTHYRAKEMLSPEMFRAEIEKRKVQK